MAQEWPEISDENGDLLERLTGAGQLSKTGGAYVWYDPIEHIEWPLVGGVALGCLVLLKLFAGVVDLQGAVRTLTSIHALSALIVSCFCIAKVHDNPVYGRFEQIRDFAIFSMGTQVSLMLAQLRVGSETAPSTIVFIVNGITLLLSHALPTLLCLCLFVVGRGDFFFSCFQVFWYPGILASACRLPLLVQFFFTVVWKTAVIFAVYSLYGGQVGGEEHTPLRRHCIVAGLHFFASLSWWQIMHQYKESPPKKSSSTDIAEENEEEEEEEDDEDAHNKKNI
jgi:hypothetical protein